MKKTIVKIISAVLICLLVSLALVACGGNGQNEEEAPLTYKDTKITKKEVDLYISQEKTSISLGFFEGVSDIAMISVDDAVKLLCEKINSTKDENYTIEQKTEGNKITLTRDNGAYAVIDFDKGTIFFDNYNKFNMLSYELGALDILDSKGFDENGAVSYFNRVICTEKAGKSSFIDLEKRNIPISMQNGNGYITLQAFSDLFLMPFELMASYNGARAFFLDGKVVEGIDTIYFEPNERERSDELIDLTYNHLCLVLDFHYGLKDEHKIDSADDYIKQIGLKNDLYSKDTAVCFSAMKKLIYKYLSDNHSSILLHSPYNSAPNYSLGADEASVGYWEFYKNYQAFSSYRKEQVENGLKAYEEIGNTAFVTFDRFTSATVNYYESSPVEGVYYDEIGLISYAHAMITREDSPIENVVIDLSANTGGHMDGGIYLVAWVLGNAIMHITDPVREAESTCIYRADVNLDGVFDQNDTISNKNVYLLTSPITFSCANYVASAFKEAGTVDIIGMHTGGGAGCVYLGSLADGSAFTLSSTLNMSEYKNGSYYNIDKGIAPDYKIDKLETLFDHTKMAEFINTLK